MCQNILVSKSASQMPDAVILAIVSNIIKIRIILPSRSGFYQIYQNLKFVTFKT